MVEIVSFARTPPSPHLLSRLLCVVKSAARRVHEVVANLASTHCDWHSRRRFTELHTCLKFELTMVRGRSASSNFLLGPIPVALYSPDSILHMTAENGNPAIALWWNASKKC